MSDVTAENQDNPFMSLLQKFIQRPQDQNVVNVPDEAAKGGSQTPDAMNKQMQGQKDPRVIYNDQGEAVDYDATDWWKKLATKPAEQGTLRNFLQRTLGPNPTNVGSAIDVSGELAKPGTASSAMLDKTPMAKQKQANLAPSPQVKDYSLPSLLPPQHLPAFRGYLLGRSGLDPKSYTPSSVPGADVLRKEMTTGDVRRKMYDQADQADAISDQFRSPKTSADSGEFQVAGDVVPLHPPGTFARNTDSGDIINGMAEKLGVEPPDNVVKVPYPLTRQS